MSRVSSRQRKQTDLGRGVEGPPATTPGRSNEPAGVPAISGRENSAEATF